MTQDEKVGEALQALGTILRFLDDTAVPVQLRVDVSMAQGKGLLVLAHAGEMTISHFADTLQISRSAASMLIAQLVELGWAQRHEDTVDRRRTFARLTAAACRSSSVSAATEPTYCAGGCKGSAMRSLSKSPGASSRSRP